MKLSAGTVELADGLGQRMITFNKPKQEKHAGQFMMPLLSLKLKNTGMTDPMLVNFFKKLEVAQQRALALKNVNKAWDAIFNPLEKMNQKKEKAKIQGSIFEGGMDLDLSGNIFSSRSLLTLSSFLNDF